MIHKENKQIENGTNNEFFFNECKSIEMKENIRYNTIESGN